MGSTLDEASVLTLQQHLHFSVPDIATQIYVVMGSNCVPIPGGMGVTDYLMLKGYQQLMSREAASQLEMLSRGMSFDVCIFLSLTAVLIGYVTIKSCLLYTSSS